MCNFLSNFSASAGPIICSYTPNIANKTVAAKEMIFTISRIVLIKAVILTPFDYEMLMKDIQAEQEALEQKLSALQTRISEQHNTEISVEQFRETVGECLNVTELTPFVLNKLISKIEIGCLEMTDGEKQQVVSVERKFV